MNFEEWYAKQTVNFDPSEIGLMQLARITWNAAQEIEREACAKLCESFLDPDIESNTSYAAKWQTEASNNVLTQFERANA